MQEHLSDVQHLGCFWKTESGEYEDSVDSFAETLYTEKDLQAHVSALESFLFLWLVYKLANSLLNPFILDMDMYVLQK